MAGTVSASHDKVGSIHKITLTCVGDSADGSFPDTTLDVFEGTLLDIETVPGATKPTAAYDITIVDADGYDVLEGVAANRSSINAEKKAIVFNATSLHPVVDQSDALTFKIANNSVNSANVKAIIRYALGAVV